MLNLILLFVTGISIIIFLSSRSSRTDTIFALPIVLLTVILDSFYNVVLSAAPGDYQNYRIVFMNVDPSGWTWRYESGYLYLNKLFSNYYWTFENFYMFLLIASLIIFIFAIKKLRSSVIVVLGLYLLSNFWIDGIQVRNTIMLAIVSLGVSQLKKSKFSYLAFVALVLLGSRFQTASLLYLLVLPVYVGLNNEWFAKRNLVIWLSLGGISLYGILTLFSSKILTLVGQYMGNDYAMVALSRSGGLLYFGIVVITVVLSYNVLVTVDTNIKEIETKRITETWNALQSVIIVSFLNVVLQSLSVEFIRIIRNNMFFMYVLIGFVLVNRINVKKRFYLLMLIEFLLVTFSVTIGQNLHELILQTLQSFFSN